VTSPDRISLDVGQKRPLIIADLVSEHLEFVDLGPLIGLYPGDGVPAEPDEATTKATPARRAFATRTDPESRRAGDVPGPARGCAPVATSGCRTEISIWKTVFMKLAPLRFGFAGGTLDLFASIYATVDPAHSDVDLRLSGYPIAGHLR
jgi:hypothetical protein